MRATGALLATCLVWSAAAAGAAVAPQNAQEERSAVEHGTAVYSADSVRAAFLYRFGSFIKWPEPPATGQMVIGVIGDPEVAAALRILLPGRRIDELPTVLRVVDNVEQLGDGQILYVGAAAASRLPSIVRALEGRAVLLVTNVPGGLQKGAIINFLLEDRRVRFEASMPAAHKARLELSSRLLGVAVRVDK